MNYKKDFPILNNIDNLVYLDSSSTTLKPKIVIDEILNYYTHLGTNIGNGEFKLLIETTKKFENSRDVVAKFINAKFAEVIFTYNATTAINIVSQGLENILKKGDEIILTYLEHSSNLLPWLKIAKDKDVKIVFAPLNNNGTINVDKLNSVISTKTKIMSFNHISNNVGGLNDAKAIVKILNQYNVISVLDASQSVGHLKVDVKDLNIDYMIFAPHKMFADSGVGVLYGKTLMLEKLTPSIVGGHMSKLINMDDNKVVYKELPYKLEAGTPNIAGVISLTPAIKYIETIGIENIWNHILAIRKYAIKELSQVDKIIIYNKDSESSNIGFNIVGISPQDINQQLANNNIGVRTGRNCSLYIEKVIDTFSYVRISLGIYNDKDDIDKLVSTLKNGGDMLDAFFE